MDYERKIIGKRPHFRPQRQGNNFYRIMLLLSLILAGVWVLLGLQRGEIERPFLPTPTPTRTSFSYLQEAQAYIAAGKLDDPDPPQPTPPNPDAIDTYQIALELDPNNAQAWAELARIQAYSSSMLRNDKERLQRLEEALASAQKAVEQAPEDSTAHGVYAFVLDWYSSNPLAEDPEAKLAQANNEAARAYQLDPNNALVLSYYAEVLLDQGKFQQARNYAEQAVERAPELMDTHRVFGFVLETWGEYNAAIKQYQKAIEIAPNMTFLYVIVGRLYREGIKHPGLALEYFANAASINSQLEVENPIPYIEIAKTYTQQGEFFIAGRNAERALEIDKFNATTYGQLGAIYIQARNYEGAKLLLKCAVRGCDPSENEMGKVAVERVPITNKTVAYYYVQYGTVLAFLSKPNEYYCPEAYEVLAEVRDAFPDDPTLMDIVADSEGLCRRLDTGGNRLTTPTPVAELTPLLPTPSPTAGN